MLSVLITILIIIVSTLLLTVLVSIFEKKERYDKMSFKEALDLIDLPIVTFYQGEEKFNFLLDTGSNYSHISSSSLERLKGEVVNASTETSGVGDTPSKTDKVVKVNLSYKDKAYYDELLVGEHLDAAFAKMKAESGISVHGIIGSKFLSRNDYILDFEEFVAYSKKKSNGKDKIKL